MKTDPFQPNVTRFYGFCILLGAIFGLCCVEVFWQYLLSGVIRGWGFAPQRGMNYALLAFFTSISTGTLAAAVAGWRQLRNDDFFSEQQKSS